MTSMKRSVLLFTCFCLAVPLTAWANSVGVSNSGGQITSNGSSLTLNGSTLIALSGIRPGTLSGKVGTVSLTTGSLISGSLASGGTFAPGGSFTIASSGNGGLAGGMLFNGTFTGPVTWTATFTPNMGPNHAGAWIYTLKGNVSGTLSNGQRISGTIMETTFDVSRGMQFSSMANLDGGTGELTSVPEPGTLGMLATGLVGLALLIKRRKTA
jgi:hypothetical protein